MEGQSFVDTVRKTCTVCLFKCLGITPESLTHGTQYQARLTPQAVLLDLLVVLFHTTVAHHLRDQHLDFVIPTPCSDPTVATLFHLRCDAMRKVGDDCMSGFFWSCTCLVCVKVCKA